MKKEQSKHKRKMSNDCLQAFLEEDFKQSDIARACKVSRQAVHSRVHWKTKPKMTAKYKLFKDLWFLGLSDRQLQKYIGYNRVDYVNEVKKRLGLKGTYMAPVIKEVAEALVDEYKKKYK